MDWQTIPLHFGSSSFTFFSVSLSWYGLCFGVGLICASMFFLMRIRRGSTSPKLSLEESTDVLLIASTGAILGARIGYVLFYNPTFFAAHPMAIIVPFDVATGHWVGISGMSAFGGIAGAIVGVLLFLRGRSEIVWPILDGMALAAPLGIFFGRIGNFLSGELFGRVTSVSWAMIFPRSGDPLPRHPSQLYEALGEGAILFILLLVFSTMRPIRGKTFSLALVLYGLIRFLLEFFREPDLGAEPLMGWMTKGQFLSIVLFSVGLFIFWWIGRMKGAILPSERDEHFMESPFSAS